MNKGEDDVTNISAPAFLAMYCVGAMVDQSKEIEREIFEGLMAAEKYMPNTIQITLRILESLPKVSSEWKMLKSEYTKQNTSSTMRGSFEMRTIRLILQRWMEATQENQKEQASGSPDSSLTSPRFFQKSPTNAISSTSTQHVPGFSGTG